MPALRCRNVELALLVALCLFLPLYEAPKNVLWLFYAAVWIANRLRARDFGGSWDVWDTLIVVWMASPFVVAPFAGLHGNEWRGSFDLVRYGGLLWMAKRSRYSATEMRWVLYALFASAVIGLLMAFARLWSGQNDVVELNSVGHVSHTSVYIAILLGAAASWLFAEWRPLAAALTIFLLASLVAAASRGAVGAGLATLVVLGAAWWPRSRKPLVVACLMAAITIAVALGSNADVIRKQQVNADRNNVLSSRDAIWRTALAAWQRYPVFGVGVDNYHRITAEQVQGWQSEAGKPFDPSRYFFISHAHSLYLNTLAERGVVGAAALAAVLLAWLIFLIRYRPRRDGHAEEPLFWGCAASAWLVSVIAGAVNTTLHHEHAILASLFLGLWLALVKQHSR